MRELYTAVMNILDKLDFNSLWSGFQQFEFALYNTEFIYFENETIPYNKEFVGNTSIEYSGRFIAIWRVDKPHSEDAELLAANIVHEMFHAFQRRKNETRFPNDLKMLDYPDSIENYQIRLHEHKLLAEAYMTDDAKSRYMLLEQFMRSRKYREHLIGDILRQEYLTETIEGLAEYIGSKALMQISPKKYTTKMTEYITYIQQIGADFFNIRKMLYYSGVIFLTVAEKAGIELHHSIPGATKSIFEIAANGIDLEKPVFTYCEELQKAFIKYTDEKRKVMASFEHTHTDVMTGDYFICGYDPMNMIKLNNKILCSHFIMLAGQDEKKPRFLQGPVLVTLKENSHDQVRAYLK